MISKYKNLFGKLSISGDRLNFHLRVFFKKNFDIKYKRNLSHEMSEMIYINKDKHLDFETVNG